MSKTRVFIYGSCVSRDTFEHLDPEQFELVEYVARQSALSATTRPVESVAPPTLTSRFQQRMVTGDFQSSLRPLLAQHAADIDVLLIDLTDERLGVYLLPDGTVVTRSVELIESGAEQSLPQGAHYVAFGTQQHYEYWSGAIRALGDSIRQTAPRAAIALLDIPWAEWSESGQQTPDSFGVGAAQANPVFRSYVEVAAQALGAHVISLDAAEVVSGPHHPWGDAPFHYAEKVYLEIVRLLTGAEGRVVWGPGASRTMTADLPSQAASTPAVATRASVRAGSGGSSYIDGETLMSLTWKLGRIEGTHEVTPVRFKEGGKIWGHAHKNESSWAIEDGLVVLKTSTGAVSTIFDQVTPTAAGPRLTGRFVLDPSLNITHVLEPVEFDWQERARYKNLTQRLMAREIDKHGWTVGDHTYGRLTVREPASAPLEIGKFCSIGSDVTVILGDHRHDLVSTYPFQTLHPFWPSGDKLPTDHDSKGPVRIGSDVAIGDQVIITSGVTIGDGAVIAAGAVVTHDVAPYSIVGGVPAREINQRFEPQQVRELLAIRWWDWPDETIDSMLPLMAQGVDVFIDAARRRNYA